MYIFCEGSRWLTVCFYESMTNTEFIGRARNHGQVPLFKTAGFHFGAVDGALILGFLSLFLALVYLLSR
jgi:hypothetical protein